MKNPRAYLLCLGHLVTDINQGALPALLPFLIQEHGLTYAAAALLVFVANAASSLIQPVFGHFADRFTKPILMPIGVFLAGAGMALTGWVDQYSLLLTLAGISGIGIAAFHPEGARLTNRIAGEQKATTMSIFALGGNLGFALGPAILTGALLSFGMKGTGILILPVSLVAWLLIMQIPAFMHAESEAKKKVSAENLKDDWGAFGRLTGAIICRAVMFYGLNTFLPLYYIYVLNQTKAAGAMALTVMFIAGLAGTLMGGRLADKYGARQVVIVGFGSLIITLPLLLSTTNVLLLTLLLIPIGLGIFAPFGPMIVLGQKYLPTRIGLASGVTLGLAISIGGVAAPILGYIADNHGLFWAVAAICGVPILAMGLGYSLPREAKQAA
ncbi:MAG: MFS transporter [Syntrophales bacterium]|nr:MFS transporter [Syntrophales bacterium]